MLSGGSSPKNCGKIGPSHKKSSAFGDVCQMFVDICEHPEKFRHFERTESENADKRQLEMFPDTTVKRSLTKKRRCVKKKADLLR